MVLLGIIILILSVFADVIIGKDGLTTTLRSAIIWPLFIIAVVLVISGIIITFFQFKTKKYIKEPLEKVDVVSQFDALRTTQKAIMKEINKYHREEISCDDLFEIFNNRHPSVIGSHSELFYRILELESKCLIETRRIGENTTIVKIPSNVGLNLERSNRLNS